MITTRHVSKMAMVICALSLAGVAQGALVGTYVDADSGTGGNTGITGNPLTDTSWAGLSGGGAGTDNIWNSRIGFAGDDLWEGHAGTGPEDAPSLTTTMTGLDAAKTYNIYVVYGREANATTGAVGTAWGIEAAISGNTLLLFDGNNNTTAQSSTGGAHSSNTVVQFQALLGQVSGVTSASVQVNDDNVVGRVWYDGVAYEEVVPIPEPASLGLITWAVMGLMSRRP